MTQDTHTTTLERTVVLLRDALRLHEINDWDNELGGGYAGRLHLASVLVTTHGCEAEARGAVNSLWAERSDLRVQLDTSCPDGE